MNDMAQVEQIATHCNMLQHTSTCCNTLQYTAAINECYVAGGGEYPKATATWPRQHTKERNLLIAFIAPLESDVVISLKTLVHWCFLLLSVGVRTSCTQETDTQCMSCHRKKDTR